VIEDQGVLWKLALNGVILRIRPRRKARDYQKIWNTENNESPLKTITRAQSEKLAAAIADHDHVVVDWAMRYGNPSIRSRIDALTGDIRPRHPPPCATKFFACSAICARSRRCG
jgi:ferrochelatase